MIRYIPPAYKRPAMSTTGYWAKSMQPLLNMYLQQQMWKERIGEQKEIASEAEKRAYKQKMFTTHQEVADIESLSPADKEMVETGYYGTKWIRKEPKVFPVKKTGGSLLIIPGSPAHYLKPEKGWSPPQVAGEKDQYDLPKGTVYQTDPVGQMRIIYSPKQMQQWSKPTVAGARQGLPQGTVTQTGPTGQVKTLYTPPQEKKPAPPPFNTLVKAGEGIIAKGMGMDVALMDKFDTNRQKEYFGKVRLYHKILELKPDWHTGMGVRKAVDFATKITAIAVNQQGQIIGKDKVTGKWIPIQ